MFCVARRGRMDEFHSSTIRQDRVETVGDHGRFSMRTASFQEDALVYVTADEGLAEVEALLREKASVDHADTLAAWFGDFLAGGGKRLRARIALASAYSLGQPRERAVPWAAAVEAMHNATLIHDDIQDEDRYRRGTETTWVKHGIAQAINVGDFGLMLPFAIVADMQEGSEIRSGLSRILAQQGIRAARGQRDMLGLLGEGRFGKSDYLRAAAGTTGSFFSLPVQGSAILAGLDDADARLVGDAFLPMGVLFQLQDDILDLYGDKGRDRRGSDLRDGKVSALVVEHLARRPVDAAWLIPLLEAPRCDTPQGAVDEAIARFQRSGALRACLDDIDMITQDLLDSPVLRKHTWLSEMAAEFITLALHPLRGL